MPVIDSVMCLVRHYLNRHDCPKTDVMRSVAFVKYSSKMRQFTVRFRHLYLPGEPRVVASNHR